MGKKLRLSSKERLTYVILFFVASCAVAFFVILLLRFSPYTMDDSFITFRYADNFYSGYGLVFNRGEVERAEGLTSPAYAIIVGQAFLLNVDVVSFSKLLGAFSAVLTSVLVFIIIYILVRRTSSLNRIQAYIPSLFGASYFISNPFIIGNSVSGMETAISTLAFAVFLLLVTTKSNSLGTLNQVEMLFIGLSAISVPLLRPEMGLAVAVVFLVLFVLLKEKRKPIAGIIAVFSFLGLSYYIARYMYYGLPLPLPFYIKQGTPFGLVSASYVVSYAKSVIFLLPLFCVSIYMLLIRDRGRIDAYKISVVAIIVAVAIQLLYYGSIRHIMGFGFRYFQPINIGVIIIASIGVSFIIENTQRYQVWLRRFILSAVAAVFMISGAHNVWNLKNANGTFIEWYFPLESKAIAVGKAFKGASDGKDYSIAINDCGAIPFYSGFTTTDLAGLSNRAIAIGASPISTINEIKEKSPQIVVLVAGQAPKPEEILGWERLQHDDVVEIGYEYFGSIKIGDGYFYMVYKIQGNRELDEFLMRLVKMNILVRPNTDNEK